MASHSPGMVFSICLMLFTSIHFGYSTVNTLCEPTDCSSKARSVEDTELKCTITKPKCEVKQAVDPLLTAGRVNVTAIHVNSFVPPNGVPFLAFHIVWQTSLTDENLNGTRGYLLTVDSRELHPSRLLYRHCRRFSISSQSFFSVYGKKHPRVFDDGCMANIETGHLYGVSVETLPSKAIVEYYVKVANVSGETDPTYWQTVVAVSMNKQLREVTVLYREASSLMNVTGYSVTLYTLVGRWATPTGNQIVGQGRGRTVFNKVSSRLFTFKVSVEPLSVECKPRCMQSNSTVLVMNEAVPTKRPHTVPPTKVTSQSTATTVDTLQPTDGEVSITPMSNSWTTSIILGTVFGVVGASLLVVLLLCLRNNWWPVSRRILTNGLNRFNRMRESDTSVHMGQVFASQPVVLLLYSNDCPIHQGAVVKFATYLRDVGKCDVQLDLWQRNEIQEKGGPFPWLQLKIDQSDFIVVVCSTGGRFKCTQKHKLRITTGKTSQLPREDAFTDIVDIVAEEMRLLGTNGNSNQSNDTRVSISPNNDQDRRVSTSPNKAPDKYICAYFEYSTGSDVPAKLGRATKYELMKDMFLLYAHIHRTNLSDPKATVSGVMADNYMNTPSGGQLQTALQAAADYFEQNPNWLQESLRAAVESPDEDRSKVTLKRGWNGHLCPCVGCEEKRHTFQVISDRDKQCFICFNWKTQNYEIPAFDEVTDKVTDVESDADLGCYPDLPIHRCPVRFPLDWQDTTGYQPVSRSLRQDIVPSDNHDEDSITINDIEQIKGQHWDQLGSQGERQWLSPEVLSVTGFSKKVQMMNRDDWSLGTGSTNTSNPMAFSPPTMSQPVPPSDGGRGEETFSSIVCGFNRNAQPSEDGSVAHALPVLHSSCPLFDSGDVVAANNRVVTVTLQKY